MTQGKNAKSVDRKGELSEELELTGNRYGLFRNKKTY